MGRIIGGMPLPPLSRLVSRCPRAIISFGSSLLVAVVGTPAIDGCVIDTLPWPTVVLDLERRTYGRPGYNVIFAWQTNPVSPGASEEIIWPKSFKGRLLLGKYLKGMGTI
jgi:hypothetical protein